MIQITINKFNNVCRSIINKNNSFVVRTIINKNFAKIIINIELRKIFNLTRSRNNVLIRKIFVFNIFVDLILIKIHVVQIDVDQIRVIRFAIQKINISIVK